MKYPICNNKTRGKIHEDTIIINFPVYCPKCKNENLIDVKRVKVINKKSHLIMRLFKFISSVCLSKNKINHFIFQN
ncbi:cysteine-rich KTR domain-containing protein [uncultured Clostridium sp.]|uniref:cysteine-rich KTR domain-containing protein n=1 Tax=uncultured Clostridium sp. TaxID=59620 RepID=UPI00351E56E0|nr:hypothetical protein [Erysipelotrichaceae bacterium]